MVGVVSYTPEACSLTLTTGATMVWIPFLTLKTLGGGISHLLAPSFVKGLNALVYLHSNVDSISQYLPLFVLIF